MHADMGMCYIWLRGDECMRGGAAMKACTSEAYLARRENAMHADMGMCSI